VKDHLKINTQTKLRNCKCQWTTNKNAHAWDLLIHNFTTIILMACKKTATCF